MKLNTAHGLHATSASFFIKEPSEKILFGEFLIQILKSSNTIFMKAEKLTNLKRAMLELGSIYEEHNLQIVPVCKTVVAILG